MGIIGVDSHARDMYGNSHSRGTCVLLEIPSMHKYYWYNIFRVYIRIHVGMRIYNELIKVYILPTLKLIFVQAVLNTVVYQMLIVYTNVLVNSAVL